MHGTYDGNHDGSQITFIIFIKIIINKVYDNLIKIIYFIHAVWLRNTLSCFIILILCLCSTFYVILNLRDHKH